MQSKWGDGYLDLTVEPSDPGKVFRVLVPGWHEGMEQPYVEEGQPSLYGTPSITAIGGKY